MLILFKTVAPHKNNAAQYKKKKNHMTFKNWEGLANKLLKHFEPQ